MEIFKHSLSETNQDCIINCIYETDVNLAYYKFIEIDKDKFNETGQYAQIYRSTRNNKSWMTNGLINVCKWKTNLYHFFQRYDQTNLNL